MMAIDRWMTPRPITAMREGALPFLPALLALVMLAGASPARTQAMSAMVLCSGGTLGVPGAPSQRECDQACHAACSRRKAGGVLPPDDPRS